MNGYVNAAAVEGPASPVGPVLAAYEARARKRVRGGQDGGMVTALLAALLEQGYVQGALVTRRQGAMSGQPVLATSPEQVRAAAGSVYGQSHPLSAIARGLPRGVEEIAVVGTPCQVAGLRALQLFPWRYRRVPADRVKLSIALFCTRSFDSQRLTVSLLRQGLDLARTAQLDIRDGWLRAYDAEGTAIFETRVKSLEDAALRGCRECADFTGVLADIAVGNLGSRRGFTTVLVRTQRGAEAWERAATALEYRELSAGELAPVADLAARNQTRGRRALRRAVGADLLLWVRYSEHLAAYQGSDAAPVAPPPHRSHHYTVAC